ncbi:hypothetical protein HPMBJEAJ_00012 [Aeromonas phage avDM6]|nr:hypothetical protein HPMBJEAJ_00012 [Aeromonas phage avDM6]
MLDPIFVSDMMVSMTKEKVMKIQFINEDVRKVLETHGKSLAGRNEWLIDLPKSSNFIIIHMSGNPLREIDNAEVVSWSLNGRDVYEVIKEIHQDDYRQTYMDMLHVMISPMLERV